MLKLAHEKGPVKIGRKSTQSQAALARFSRSSGACAVVSDFRRNGKPSIFGPLIRMTGLATLSAGECHPGKEDAAFRLTYNLIS
jgi:hypothetical protein